MGIQPLYGERPHLLLWVEMQAAHGKVTVSGIPNPLNFCVSFMVYTLFTNVSVVHIIQPLHKFYGIHIIYKCVSGPHNTTWRAACRLRVGDPWNKVQKLMWVLPFSFFF